MIYTPDASYISHDMHDHKNACRLVINKVVQTLIGIGTKMAPPILIGLERRPNGAVALGVRLLLYSHLHAGCFYSEPYASMSRV